MEKESQHFSKNDSKDLSAAKASESSLLRNVQLTKTLQNGRLDD